MKKLMQKFTSLFKNSHNLELLSRLIAIENELATLEKTNLLVLTKLLQAQQALTPNNKRDDKREIFITSPQDLHAGKSPTYH